jgi:hypothetical protein
VSGSGAVEDALVSSEISEPPRASRRVEVCRRGEEDELRLAELPGEKRGVDEWALLLQFRDGSRPVDQSDGS